MIMRMIHRDTRRVGVTLMVRCERILDDGGWTAPLMTAAATATTACDMDAMDGSNAAVAATPRRFDWSFSRGVSGASAHSCGPA